MIFTTYCMKSSQPITTPFRVTLGANVTITLMSEFVLYQYVLPLHVILNISLFMLMMKYLYSHL